MKRLFSFFFVTFCALGSMRAQASHGIMEPLLKQHLTSPDLVADQLQHFMLPLIPPLKMPADAKQWNRDAAEIRAHELSVIYHGWPKEWIDAAPKFEEAGEIQGHGYRI